MRPGEKPFLRVTVQLQAVDKWLRPDESVRPVWLTGVAAVAVTHDLGADPVHEIRWTLDEGQFFQMTTVDPAKGDPS